jgi:hypothetical protein
MMNSGFLSRATEIHAAQTTFSGGDLWKLNMDKGYPYSVAILSEHYIELLVHFFKGAPASICNKMYFAPDDPEAECLDCLKPGYQDKGFNRAGLVRCFIGYVFDLVDKKDKTKQGKEFTHNPLKIIEVGSGRGQVNFGQLNEAIAGKYLTYDPNSGAVPNIWRIKRKTEEEGGGMAEPAILSLPELQKLGRQFKAVVPDDVLEVWNKRAKGEVLGYMINTYSNVNKPLLESEGIIFPSKEEAEAAMVPPDEEEVDNSLDQ